MMHRAATVRRAASTLVGSSSSGRRTAAVPVPLALLPRRCASSPAPPAGAGAGAGAAGVGAASAGEEGAGAKGAPMPPPPRPTPPSAAAAGAGDGAGAGGGSLINVLLAGAGLVGGAAALDYTFNDGKNAVPAAYWLMDNPGMTVLRLLDPERAHDLAIWTLKNEFVPQNKCGPEDVDPSLLRVSLWNGLLSFPNPVGVAAGFDKHAEAMKGLFGLGLGFVEIGSVTPEPQPGNPKPRMFRLVEDRAVINRYGFNSDGVAAAKRRLEGYWEARLRGEDAASGDGLVGVNVGKNKLTDRAEDDYVLGVQELGEYADYLVVNVSSPNTPGLRSLQRKGAMESLIRAVQKANKNTRNVRGKRVPLLIKIAPDLTEEEKADIAAVALRTKIDGLIVSNTTISRPDSLQSGHKGEAGGLSGAPLKALATQTIADMYRLTKYGRVPIIGVGGVGSGQDAYEKILAGASLVQVYSMLVYEGPGSVRRIKEELAALLQRDGYASVADAVGAAHRNNKKGWF